MTKTETYMLTNMITGDTYIGVSSDKRGLKQRLAQHKSRAKKGKHNHIPLYENIKEYGWDNFYPQVLGEGNDEKYYCWLMRPTLNQCWVGRKPISEKQVKATIASRIVAVRDKHTGKEYPSMKEARADTGILESSISRSLKWGPGRRWDLC